MTSILVEEKRRRDDSLNRAWLLVVPSLLLHVLIFLLLGWGFRAVKEPEPDTKPIEFRIVDPEDIVPPPETPIRSTRNSQDAGEVKPVPPSAAGRPNTQAPLPPRPQPPAPRPVAAQPAPPKPVAPPPPAPPPPVRAQSAIAQATPRPQPSPTPATTPPLETPAPRSTPAPPTRASQPTELAPAQPTQRTSDLSQLAPDSPPAPPRQPSTQQRSADASQLGEVALNPGNGTNGRTQNGIPNPTQAAPGRPSVAARADVDWGPYLARLQRRVEQNWIPGQSGASLRTVVIFSIGRNGQLNNIRLGRSSGSPQTDDAALSAIQRSTPFESLPAGYEGGAVQINFTFDINVLGQLSGGAFSP